MRPKADGRSSGETTSSCGSTPWSEPRGSGRNASSGRPSTVQQAIDRGELAGAEADQLAFEIEALDEAVIPQSRLLERDAVYAAPAERYWTGGPSPRIPICYQRNEPSLMQERPIMLRSRWISGNCVRARRPGIDSGDLVPRRSLRAATSSHDNRNAARSAVAGTAGSSRDTAVGDSPTAGRPGRCRCGSANLTCVGSSGICSTVR